MHELPSNVVNIYLRISGETAEHELAALDPHRAFIGNDVANAAAFYEEELFPLVGGFVGINRFVGN